ncbi:uncharacterized protein AMSG_11751 [Thecamonas trahens ATCC 50062]|uniref:Uncharacterized protein n=1 Tax=Thecamonas trahens ATCC 50062 TaxID=461836 RepID=A0A0L0D5X6_THETB|nr:hypothetical protein AMSG_11751 [Thecamonas trahens ATCC 50062]KNC46713.1 hypothetical protein AMSG_11751 [Thecamonas trahens ATCC 50062]|eukprot:XP_013760500.1 hypothetical protein AMSG_11751 [Thecamonas trahens ATCC 50062]
MYRVLRLAFLVAAVAAAVVAAAAAAADEGHGGGLAGEDLVPVEEMVDPVEVIVGEAHASNGYGRARAALETLAEEEDNMKAALELGLWSLLGTTVDEGDEVIDVAAAQKWLGRAAERGLPEAQAYVGLLHSLGLARAGSVERDEALAVLHLFFAARGSSRVANAALGFRHRHALAVPGSCDTAANYYRKAAEDVAAQIVETGAEPEATAQPLSDEVKPVDGSTNSDEDIVDFYEYSASQGSPSAAVALGKLHWTGARGLARDVPAAVQHFEQAAAAGSPEAMANLGHVYAAGDDGVPQNTDAAIEWYTKAVDAGSASALNGLGFMYLHGTGVEADSTKAFDYIAKSAAMGNADAQLNLGTLYFNGETADGEPDYKRAHALFVNAAHQGRTLATYYLGLMHAQGLGTARSCASALSLFKTAVERGLQENVLKTAHAAYDDDQVVMALVRYLVVAMQGVELAQRNAAYILHHHGDESRVLALFGGSSDAVRALHLRMLALSALQGNVDANLALGDYYFDTERDYELALSQYRAGANRGHPQALFNLGYMHQHGLGLPLDLHLAKRFYDQAWETSPDAALPAGLALIGLHIQVTNDELIATTGYPLDRILLGVIGSILIIVIVFRLRVAVALGALLEQRAMSRRARRAARRAILGEGD